MQTAVRWAISSARDDTEPCLTSFVMPFHDKTGPSYQQWLGHPLVHIVAKIPKKAIKLQTPEAWKTGKVYKGHPKCDYLLFVVANNIGIHNFVKPDVLGREMQRMMRESHSSFEVHIPHARMTMHRQANAQEQSLPFFPPRRFTDELPASEVRVRISGSFNIPDAFLETKPLKWQAEQIIYTDGSVRDTGEPEYYRSGAGVHRPASDMGSCTDLCINPTGD